MAEVLSQDEIDQLLTAINAGNKDDPRDDFMTVDSEDAPGLMIDRIMKNVSINQVSKDDKDSIIKSIQQMSKNMTDIVNKLERKIDKLEEQLHITQEEQKHFHKILKGAQLFD
jgi:flagellar motor switch protein FliM